MPPVSHMVALTGTKGWDVCAVDPAGSALLRAWLFLLFGCVPAGEELPAFHWPLW